MKKSALFAIIILLPLVVAISMMTILHAFSESFQRGDVNQDGMVNSIDYLMVKRFVLGTLLLNENQQSIADTNNDGHVDAMDYLITKRCVLGTYWIKDWVEVSKAEYSQGLAFEETSNGNYSLVGIGTCKDTHIIVPEVYKGRDVVEIGRKAFANQTQIMEISLPESIRTIGARAFYNTGISELSIPENVRAIGTQIVYKCPNMQSLVFNGTEYSSDGPAFENSNIHHVLLFLLRYFQLLQCLHF